MDNVLNVLKTMGHSERLRILALLSYGELTIKELVQIMGISQPRVTQYMKSLEDAKLVDRVKQGSWVFSRIDRRDPEVFNLVSTVLDQLPVSDALLKADRRRLENIREKRALAADAFFADVANDDGQLGDEYLPRDDIETHIKNKLDVPSFEFMIDLGTGTGRMLELFADKTQRGAGVDNNAEMLKVARHKLSKEGLQHLSVRLGDLTATPFGRGVADLVTIHQVLHYLDDPSEAVREAARLLQPGGHVFMIDFVKHEFEEFRDKYAHRRLGFEQTDIESFASDHGLKLIHTHLINSQSDKPDVKIWLCQKPES